MVPKVFMHDEMNSRECGARVTEFMSLHCIFFKNSIGGDRLNFMLVDKWDEKSVIICLEKLILNWN